MRLLAEIRTASAGVRGPWSLKQKIAGVFAASLVGAIALALLGIGGPEEIFLAVVMGAYGKAFGSQHVQTAEKTNDTLWAQRDNTRETGRLAEQNIQFKHMLDKALHMKPGDVIINREADDETGPQHTHTLN